MEPIVKFNSATGVYTIKSNGVERTYQNAEDAKNALLFAGIATDEASAAVALELAVEHSDAQPLDEDQKKLKQEGQNAQQQEIRDGILNEAVRKHAAGEALNDKEQKAFDALLAAEGKEAEGKKLTPEEAHMVEVGRASAKKSAPKTTPTPDATPTTKAPGTEYSRGKVEDLEAEGTAKKSLSEILNDLKGNGVKFENAADLKAHLKEVYGFTDAELPSDKALTNMMKSLDNVSRRTAGVEGVQKIYTPDQKELYKQDPANATILNKRQYKAAKKLSDDAKAALPKQKAEFEKQAVLLEQAQKEFQQAKAALDADPTNPNLKTVAQDKADKLNNLAAGLTTAFKLLATTYFAAQMIKEDGTIDVDSYKMTMIGYAGEDLRLNMDERVSLANAAGSKKAVAKNLAKAAGLEYDKSQKWADVLKAFGKGALVGAAVGSGLGLIGAFLGTVGVTVVPSVVNILTETVVNNKVHITEQGGIIGGGQTGTDGNGQGSGIFFDGDGPTSTTTYSSSTTTMSRTTEGTGNPETIKKKVPWKKTFLHDLFNGAIAGGLGAAVNELLRKGETMPEDLFRKEAAGFVLHNPQIIKDEACRAFVQAIDKMPNLTEEQKVSLIEEAYGQQTGKTVVRDEMAAAYQRAAALNDRQKPTPQGEVSTPEVSTPEESTPEVSTPEVSTPETSTPEQDAPIHHDEANYNLNTRGVGMQAYVIATYGVNPGTPEYKAIRDAIKQENPGLWGADYKIGTKVHLPEVEFGGKTYKPDLTKQPKPARPARARRNPNRFNGYEERWGEGAQHGPGQVHGTKEEAQEAANTHRKKPEEQ